LSAALLMIVSFESAFQVREGAKPWLVEFRHPALGDRVDRDDVDEVQLLAALPLRRDEVRVLEDREVLRDGLARHVQSFAKCRERLAVLPAQAVEQKAAAGV